MPTKSNISLQELQTVLEKSGLPMGDSFAMRQAKPGLRQQIAGGFGPSGSDQTRKRIMAQLDQIAQMDQKLGGVYGDPTSKLFIENPMAREQATYGHRGTGFQEVSRLGNVAEAQDAQREADITEAEQTYNELATAQAALEAEEKRLAKKGKGKGTNKSASGGKLTKEQKIAGFKDFDAANYWSKIKEADFKRQWVQGVLQEENSVPDDGFSVEDVQGYYKNWKAGEEKRKAAEKAKKEAEKKKQSKSGTKKSLF